MKKQVVRICEGVERNAWISETGNYRVLDGRGLGYVTGNQYVVQVREYLECGFVWFICRDRGRFLASKTLREAKALACSAEESGVSF